MDIYEVYVEQLKELGYLTEDGVSLEKVMDVARRASLPLDSFGKHEMKDRLEFKLFLAPTLALFEAYKEKGDNGYIVYSDSNGDIVNHFVDGRIVVKSK